MKTKLIVVASTLLLAGPVLAQEPLEKSGTQPSTTENMPAPAPAATPEPLDNAGTAPAGQATTTANPASPEPLDKAGSQQAATPAPVGEVLITELRETEDDNKMVSPLNATVDKVEEMDVYDANGKKIAEVDAVLEDKDGNVKGVAIEYGGFLGIGQKGAVVTFDKMKTKDGNIVVDMTEEDLGRLPAWKD